MSVSKRALAALFALIMVFSAVPAVFAQEESAEASAQSEGAFSGVGTLYITSADKSKDRLWVEQSKDNKAKGDMLLLDDSGNTLYSGALTQIKGRGNTTWELEKKPYQIKLAEKAELVDEAGKAKTWILLASYCDPTFLRTQVANDLSLALGLDCAIRGRWVELYYDGEYRGLYILCEKVEVGGARVDIPNLEDAVEAANLDNPAYANPETTVAELGSGLRYCYVAGLSEPELSPETYGCLLELEYPDRYEDEQSWMVTARGQALVFKNPEYLTKETGAFYAALWQAFEDAVYAPDGKNPDTGKYFYEYCDLDSLIAMYLVEELTKNQDAFFSSTYFYFDPADGLFHAGPPWDFDFSLGAGNDAETVSLSPQDLQAGEQYLMLALYRLPEFRAALAEALDSAAYQNAVKTLLSGENTPGAILWYARQLEDAAKRNAALWGNAPFEPTAYRIAGIGSGLTYNNMVSFLYTFLADRSLWLSGFVKDNLEEFLRYGYTDISPEDWYTEAVLYVTEKGILNGDRVTAFGPGNLCSRAMLITALYRLAGSPAASAPDFMDVQPDDWFAASAAWAREAGIAQGDENGNFNGSATLTRGEAAAILYRYAAYKGMDTGAPGDLTFADTAAIPQWARPGAAYCQASGIITGDENGYFAADGLTTRAQLATILMRMMEGQA